MSSIVVFLLYMVPSVMSQYSLFPRLQTELFEGDVCNATQNPVWICRSPWECPSIAQDILQNRKPPICSYQDKTPIICCRGEDPEEDVFINRGKIFEGDECKRTEEYVWTCQRPSKCPSASDDLRVGKKPAICGFDGRTPIICCREEKFQRIRIINSETACHQYEKWCSLTKRISATTESSLITRRNAQDPIQNQPALSSIGGVESAPKEFPNMDIGNETITQVFAIYHGTETAPKEFPHMEIGNDSLPRFAPGIIGGIDTAPKEYPHMALIGYGEADSISWACGGSLISDRYVLSAAHCTFPGPTTGPARWARLGDLNIATNSDDAKPQEYEIASRTNHPGYNPPALYNDIALYKLNQSVTFSAYISPVCLSGLSPHYYWKVIATGWGRIGPSGPVSKHLMKVDISLVPHNVCNDLVKQEYQLPLGIDKESMICAGEMEGGKDTCQGDSGGPLMLNGPHVGCVHQQVGVTSFGKICGSERSPGVYTRVSHYIPWIESIVWP